MLGLFPRKDRIGAGLVFAGGHNILFDGRDVGEVGLEGGRTCVSDLEAVLVI